ncbi:MAG: prolipoprotein diacylglyceryl transferase [Bacteroidales bacterium]|nr:prolipoprotein diacylglyceryl transferase [Bacteroidales bacterium]
MLELMYITWNPDPTIIEIGGFTLRWYSLFWVIALLTGSHVVYKLYELKKLPMETFQTLFMYSFVGILAGARLGHCLFYDPEYYLNHPLEIVLPVHFLPNGDWKFTGYAGLASHGGTLGLIIALVLFCRKTKIHCLDILDMMGVAAPVAAGFIRIANLMNSEIIGMPTQVPWAFVFERVDMQARHPAQLYEAIAYFVIFLLIGFIYKRYSSRCRKGFFFGLCLTLIYAFRFFIEYIKERQVDFEESLPIDMGQILSIPLVVIGLYFVAGRFQWKKSVD